MPAARIGLWLALAGICTLALVGCQPEPPPPPSVPETAPPPPPAPVKPDVEPLLEQARRAFDAHRLTTPEENSAFALYREALRLDPENDKARRGIEKIVERYVMFALQAVERQQLARARSMLARARLVDADHPAIAPTEQQLQLLQTARRQRQKLDAGALSRREQAMGTLLRGLGGQAKATGCRVTINARSDAEGRWVYRQLNSAEGAMRIRAKLQIASPPSVELLCPNPPGP